MTTLATIAAILVVGAAIVALWLAARLRAWRGSTRARRRSARAVAGEERAADLLVAAGFTIVERQARVDWAPLVDGRPCPTPLRADYLVEVDGQMLVAEVKTGAVAPSITTAATRRQLLEYCIAFAADGVLLVCPERDEIHRVVFPRAWRGVMAG